MCTFCPEERSFFIVHNLFKLEADYEWAPCFGNSMFAHDVTFLLQVSIKICNPEYGKVGIQATNVVLPCLLSVGLGSQVKEVRIIR